jgi:protein-tyrosine-phosphatase
LRRSGSTSDHRPTAIEDLEDLDFDLAVTLSPQAHHRALELTRTLPMAVEYWPMPDPTLAVGSRGQILDAYRDLRERLASPGASANGSAPAVPEFTGPGGSATYSRSDECEDRAW